jgi:hypothetical protein
MNHHTNCPRCFYDEGCALGGFGIARDCLAKCSDCGATVQSIDYLHTCKGGQLCAICWHQDKPGNAVRGILLGAAMGAVIWAVLIELAFRSGAI